MNISAADFRRHFELLSDEALLATNPGDLTELARTCLAEEIAARGLDEPAEAPGEEGEKEGQDEGGPAAAQHEAPAGLVIVAQYSIAEEASLARGLLESAEIPCRIATEYVAMGPADYRLVVPEEFVEHALEILSHEISDEELAAQAEAAGPHPDEAFEEEYFEDEMPEERESDEAGHED